MCVRNAIKCIKEKEKWMLLNIGVGAAVESLSAWGDRFGQIDWFDDGSCLKFSHIGQDFFLCDRILSDVVATSYILVGNSNEIVSCDDTSYNFRWENS